MVGPGSGLAVDRNASEFDSIGGGDAKPARELLETLEPVREVVVRVHPPLIPRTLTAHR